MNSTKYFLKMLTTEDFMQLPYENIELPPEEHKVRTGFIKYDELGSVFENSDVEPEIGDKEMQIENEDPQMASSTVVKKNEKHSKIDNRVLDMYFADKVKPKQISKMLKIDSIRVYRVVEQTNKALIKLTKVGKRWMNKKRRITEDVKQIIEEYWRVSEHRLFTVEDVRKYIKEKAPSVDPPSSSFVAVYMKTSMRLSYKKVSWRPLKVLSNEITSHRSSYINFIERARSMGFRIVQIDEFAVSRLTCPTRAWTAKGVSGFSIQEQPSFKYSVIAAISEDALELATISKDNTNGDVFVAFLEELDKRLSIRYGDRKRSFIMTCDRARYHSTKDVKRKVDELKITLVQTVPYSPEFSPVEIFINWVKSHIKKYLRKLK